LLAFLSVYGLEESGALNSLQRSNNDDKDPSSGGKSMSLIGITTIMAYIAMIIGLALALILSERRSAARRRPNS
jgi:hypothetical protein